MKERLNTIADNVSSVVKSLNFGLNIHPHTYFVCMSSEGSGKFAHMNRLT